MIQYVSMKWRCCMFKRILILFACSMLFAGVTTGASINGSYKGYSIVKVLMNGEEVIAEVPGINLDGVTMIPLRSAVQALGAKVSWNDNSYTASIALTNQQPLQGIDNIKKYTQALKATLNSQPLAIDVSYSVLANEEKTFIIANYYPKRDISTDQLKADLVRISALTIIADFDFQGISMNIYDKPTNTKLSDIVVTAESARRFANKEISLEGYTKSWSWSVIEPVPQTIQQQQQQNPAVPIINNSAICSNINKKYDNMIRDFREDMNARGLLNSTITITYEKDINDQREMELKNNGCSIN
jgi:hypothetical protein